MRGQEGGILPDWVRGWAVPFRSLQPRGFATTTKLLIFIFSFDSNKLNNPIVGSLVGNGSRVFNDIHSRGQILYESFLRNIRFSTISMYGVLYTNQAK